MDSERPAWVTALAVACLIALAANVVRDLFIAETRDIEIWFGFEITGWAALLTAPLHWAILAVGAWGFWTCRPWIWPASATYLFYVALSHLVWSEVSPIGRGWPIGLLQAVVISLAALALLRAGARLSAARSE